MNTKILNKELILKIAIDLLNEEKEQCYFHSEHLANVLSTMEVQNSENYIPLNNKIITSYKGKIDSYLKSEEFLKEILSKNIIMVDLRNTDSNLKNITPIVRKLANNYLNNYQKFKNQKLTEEEQWGEFEFEKRIQFDFNLDSDSYLLAVKRVVKYFFYTEN